VLKKEISEQEIIGIAKDCAKVLVEKKAGDVMVLDLREINSYLNYFVIATANSHIHCSALAKAIERYCREIDFSGNSKPRLDSGWIALDYNEIVIHIFTKELREYYQLEKLWGDAEFLSF
jgi:ribosome-associated protein